MKYILTSFILLFLVFNQQIHTSGVPDIDLKERRIELGYEVVLEISGSEILSGSKVSATNSIVICDFPTALCCFELKKGVYYATHKTFIK